MFLAEKLTKISFCSLDILVLLYQDKMNKASMVENYFRQRVLLSFTLVRSD